MQGVNLTRPMIARLLGMAKLEVIGAVVLATLPGREAIEIAVKPGSILP